MVSMYPVTAKGDGPYVQPQDFELAVLTKDVHRQRGVLQQCRETPSFQAESMLKLADLSRTADGSNPEVTREAFQAALKLLLSKGHAVQHDLVAQVCMHACVDGAHLTPCFHQVPVQTSSPWTYACIYKAGTTVPLHCLRMTGMSLVGTAFEVIAHNIAQHSIMTNWALTHEKMICLITMGYMTTTRSADFLLVNLTNKRAGCWPVSNTQGGRL